MSDRLRVTMFADAYGDYVLSLSPHLGGRCELTLVHQDNWDDVPALASGPDSPVTTIAVPMPRIRDPRRLRTTWAVTTDIQRRRPDILHIQQSGDPWFQLAMLLHRPHVPTVVTIHDVRPHPGDRAQVVGNASLQRTWKRHVDHFIVHAPSLAEDLSREWKLHPDRISVVDHAEIGTLYRRRAGTGRQPATRESTTVLFYGRRWTYKGLSVLVEAIRLMAATRDDLVLIVAGTGEPLEPTLSPLPGNVTVECHDHRVNDLDTVDLFDRATVVCLPYIEASQSGVASLAVGMGTPIVATDVGGIPRLVRDGVDGRLVKPNDPAALAAALAAVLDDPALQRSMRTNLLARSRDDLSCATISEQIVDIYERVAGR